jgi:hypothetical protein
VLAAGAIAVVALACNALLGIHEIADDETDAGDAQSGNVANYDSTGTADHETGGGAAADGAPRDVASDTSAEDDASAGGTRVDATSDAPPPSDAGAATSDGPEGVSDAAGSIAPGPACASPDGAVPRTPFNASQFLVGPGTAYAAPKSGCGSSVHFSTSSPARVEAENFDVGGEGISYHDTTPHNYYGQYRGEDVDVEWGVCSIPCADVDYIAPGEWAEYTIDVSKTWSYSITVEYAARGNESIHLNLDGQRTPSQPLALPATTYDPAQPFNYLSFKALPTYMVVCLPQGRHILRITYDGPATNYLALDYIDFGPVGPCGGGD